MKCERCGKPGAVHVAREPGKVPAQATLCLECAVAWEKRKALLQILGPAGAKAL